MRTKLYYENRIHKLSMKDPVANKKLIAKLERKLRALTQ